MKIAKLVEGRLVEAPSALRIGGVLVSNPPVQEHLRQGWKLVPDGVRPLHDAPEGYEWARSGWREMPLAILPAWRLVKVAPPPPRVFVTADLVEALMAEDIWTDVRSWIETQGLLDLVLATKEFDENNENFQAGKTALQTALGWTDEEVEELLAKCVKEVY